MTYSNYVAAIYYIWESFGLTWIASWGVMNMAWAAGEFVYLPGGHLGLSHHGCDCQEKPVALLERDCTSLLLQWHRSLSGLIWALHTPLSALLINWLCDLAPTFWSPLTFLRSAWWSGFWWQDLCIGSLVSYFLRYLDTIGLSISFPLLHCAWSTCSTF